MSQASQNSLDAPLRDVAERIGYDELHEQLTKQSGPLFGPQCPECGRSITKTTSWGEVGHQYNCSRRVERYSGQSGRRQENYGGGCNE